MPKYTAHHMLSHAGTILSYLEKYKKQSAECKTGKKIYPVMRCPMEPPPPHRKPLKESNRVYLQEEKAKLQAAISRTDLAQKATEIVSDQHQK